MQILQLKSHCFIYRGFTIKKIPRNKLRQITRYQVSQNEQSFGLFDAMAEATKYIDKLYGMRG
ncbi:hypothetical protein [Providencia rettgeri]|uniref:Uncharacterized protein n=1 Tax=Providencia rettgeri TaxID=587 RepID=A0A9N8D2P4_PRORE|nr:hypothetical protein [Providencia rettgeri]CAB5682332.1 Uncharacterised protein [Providencia rettgeri]CAB5715165.1 Uncharacterised protein [Providencia rettgeri]CAC9206715.1 Uncharacterised protein [Providencia rettgeri]CAC9283848.1 Uncharacterised protein [Providencia rettgeri]